MHKRYSDVDDKDKDKNAPQDHVLDLFCHVLEIVPLKGGGEDSPGLQVHCNTLKPNLATHYHCTKAN